MLAILALQPPLAAPIDQKRCDLDHRAAILIRTRLPNPSLLRALILVGRALGGEEFDDSKLYDPAHYHVLRPATSDGGST